MKKKKIWLEKKCKITGLCYPYIFIITTLATFSFTFFWAIQGYKFKFK